MTKPQAYLNGRYVDASQAVVSVADGGFVQGTTVAEQLRTFGGKLFRLSQHVERLFHSLEIVGVDPRTSPDEVARVAEQLAAANHALLSPDDDLGLAILVTPGAYPAMATAAPEGPTICLHTFPLRFDLWAGTYRTGQALATTDIAQVPSACWPPELKCRSRMHYYLADRQAHARYPGSRALMLDDEGFVTETTTSNVVAYDAACGLVTPPRHKVLPGISLAVLGELAAGLGLAFGEQDLRPNDLAAADEVLLTGTSACMLPVVALDGRAIGDGSPGRVFGQLMSAWNELAGVDIIRQALGFTDR